MIILITKILITLLLAIHAIVMSLVLHEDFKSQREFGIAETYMLINALSQILAIFAIWMV